MASILSVGEVRGLQENSNTVTVPSGHTLDVSSGTFLSGSGQVVHEQHYTYSTRVTYSANTLVNLFPAVTFIKQFDAATSRLYLEAQIVVESNWSYANAPYIRIDASSNRIDGFAAHIDTANTGDNQGSFNKAVQFKAPLENIAAGSRSIDLYLKDNNISGYNNAVVVNPTSTDDPRYPTTNTAVMMIREVMI